MLAKINKFMEHPLDTSKNMYKKAIAPRSHEINASRFETQDSIRQKVSSEFRGDVFEASEGIHADPYYAAVLGPSYGSSGHSEGIARREELFQKTRQIAASLRRTSDAPVPGTGVAFGAGTASFVSLAASAHPGLGAIAAAGAGVVKGVGAVGVHIGRNHYGDKAADKLVKFSHAARQAERERSQLESVLISKLGPEAACSLEAAAQESDAAYYKYNGALSGASLSSTAREVFLSKGHLERFQGQDGPHLAEVLAAARSRETAALQAQR